MSEIATFPDLAAVAEEAARRWVQIAGEAVERQGRFTIALSGGSTVEPLYRLMASEPWRSQAPWAHTYVFWGDERRVPPTHPDSNYRMATELLLSQVPVPPRHIFRMAGEDLAKSAEKDYRYALERHFGLGRREFPRFDLMLLGLGADGHIASIFPGTRAVSDLSSMVIVYPVPQLGVERMTLTLPVFNNARHILVMVAGAEKAGALYSVLRGPYAPSTYPAQALKPVDGTLTWLVDEAAASRL